MADYADLDNSEWAELTTLQRATWRAERALEGFCAEHREPTADWDPAPHEELTRLRGELAAANEATDQHPALAKAREVGCRHQTVVEVRRRAREQADT